MELDRRKQSLLEAIVVTYVNRAEPVGSHYLASQECIGVRSATIRNELAEMTDRGYLLQPHTSAGRIPSDRGYRFYVDHLMASDRLPGPDARAIRTVMRMNEGDLDLLLLQTSRVLSSLTRYTAVVTPPADVEPRVRQVHAVQAAPQRLLLVVVLDSGRVVHRFAEVHRSLSPAEVTLLGNVLHSALENRAVSEVGATPALVPGMEHWEETLRGLLAAVAGGLADEEGDFYLEGASHMLEQPEFRDSNKVEPLVRFLEERKTAFETLKRILQDDAVKVSIGQENPHESMREVSVVAARYQAGPRTGGWIGVLGPTRMHYAQAVPAVQYVARALSETLARLGVE
jgi:heat-inducible transcriptional repressor